LPQLSHPTIRDFHWMRVLYALGAGLIHRRAPP
jgi:hypothetical protein